MFNQNPSQVLYNPQKTNFNPISEIKNHTIQRNNQKDPPHAKVCISPTLETKNPELLRKSTYCSVDEFIDEVIEGQETVISSDVCKKFDTLTFLKGNKSRVIYHQSSSINSVETHQNDRNLLNILANMFISKPPFQTTKE